MGVKIISYMGSYLADPTSPIPSHCAVIILFKGVPVHQLSWLALYELTAGSVHAVKLSRYVPNGLP